MDWKEIAAKVTSAAPLLGSLFGPAGTLIGTGVKLFASALGVEPTEEAVLKELTNNPESLLKLKEFEGNNKVELERLAIQRVSMEYADTADARKRQTDSERATGKRDYNLYVLAWTIIGGYFGLTSMLLYFSYTGKPIQDATGVLFMLFGTLSTAFGMVVGYFFGSSKGSADKMETLAITTRNLTKK